MPQLRILSGLGQGVTETGNTVDLSVYKGRKVKRAVKLDGKIKVIIDDNGPRGSQGVILFIDQSVYEQAVRRSFR
jgi:hypothetical protein